MRSYNRNSRKQSPALTLAIATALLAGAAAHAMDASTKFVLTAYVDGAGGESLVAGNYDAAISAVNSPSARINMEASALQTNKCVAYTMSGRLDAARSFCTDAILAAKTDLSQSAFWERKVLKDYLAVAYSNRAVLDWITHDAAKAATDLAEAGSLSPESETVARNISALHSPHENMPPENAVAQLAITPRR